MKFGTSKQNYYAMGFKLCHFDFVLSQSSLTLATVLKNIY
jgi:hypothetical protein